MIFEQGKSEKVEKQVMQIWSTYSSARAALLFLLITPNALNYPVTAISQNYKAFVLSIHAFN